MGKKKRRRSLANGPGPVPSPLPRPASAYLFYRVRRAREAAVRASILRMRWGSSDA